MQGRSKNTRNPSWTRSPRKGPAEQRIDVSQMEQLIRTAWGLPKDGTDAAPSASTGRQETSELDAKRSQLARLSIDLLLTTRQSGLSPTESGCFFLLLAAHLLDDLPAQSLTEMIGEVRRRASEART